MSETRKVRKVMRAKPTIEGAGVQLKRAFGFSEVPNRSRVPRRHGSGTCGVHPRDQKGAHRVCLHH